VPHRDRLSIQRLRRRLPFVVFVLVLILFVVMLGFACLCMTDHPTQAAERAISAIAHAPAIIELWAALVVLFCVQILLPAVVIPRASGRASPVYLQCFRF
jgi:nitric oxide reductase large subunit